jgi:DinB superfamily
MPQQQLQPDEYLPHHVQYVSLVPAPILDVLRDQRITIPHALRGISEAQADHRYAPDKWNIRQCVGHMSDAERIFQFRALVFARENAASVPRYSPDEYVERSGFEHRTMQSLIEEFVAVRESTLHLFRTLQPDAWNRTGTISGGIVSVRAMAYIAAGHAQRHLNVLYERYGLSEPGEAVSVA